MASQLEIIGEIECFCCRKIAPVKVQKNGHTMVYCSWCGNKTQSYAQKATDIIKSRMTPNAVEKTPETVPPADQKQEQKPKAGFWA